MICVCPCKIRQGEEHESLALLCLAPAEGLVSESDIRNVVVIAAPHASFPQETWLGSCSRRERAEVHRRPQFEILLLLRVVRHSCGCRFHSAAWVCTGIRARNAA